MGLTLKRIEKLLNEPGRYFDADGLYLKVPPKSLKAPRARRGSWLLRYEIGGNERWCGLGKVADFDLSEARERARKARQQLRDGQDPIERKREDKARAAFEEAKLITFETATRQYLEQHEGAWKNPKSAKNFTAAMEKYVFPTIGRLSVAAVDTGLVLKVVEPIWKEIPVSADRIRNRIEAVLDWCTVRNYRTGDNPARWKNHLSEVLPKRSKIAKVQHLKAIPFAEVPSFVRALANRNDIASRALEFCILTASRTSEVIGMRWDEVNLNDKLWVVPASRIKGGKEHRVPLTDRAIEILKALPTEQNNPFVFLGPNNVKLSDVAMLKVMKAMNRSETVHGFRSSFMDWAHERTAYPKVVIDMALAHVVGDKVEAAYRRGDLLEKRRKLLAEWSRFCLTPTVTGTVVALRG